MNSALPDPVGSPRHSTGTEEMAPREAGFHVFPLCSLVGVRKDTIHYHTVQPWDSQLRTVRSLVTSSYDPHCLHGILGMCQSMVLRVLRHHLPAVGFVAKSK